MTLRTRSFTLLGRLDHMVESVRRGCYAVAFWSSTGEPYLATMSEETANACLALATEGEPLLFKGYTLNGDTYLTSFVPAGVVKYNTSSLL